MPVINVTPGTDEWHQLRATNIGGSEIASLVPNAGGFHTPYQLWADKSGIAPLPPVDPAVLDGAFDAEPYIIQKAGKHYDMRTKQNVSEYYTHPVIPGMGCTPDGFIWCSERGRGVIQVKTMDAFQWVKQKDIPLKYQLQLQHEIACTDLSWGVLAMQVNTREFVYQQYDRHDAAISALEKLVTRFWESVETGNPPPVTGDDINTINQVFAGATISDADLSGDNEVPKLINDFTSARAARLEAEKLESSAKAELLAKMAGAAVATTSSHILSNKRTTVHYKAQAARTTEQMRFSIKEIKQ